MYGIMRFVKFRMSCIVNGIGGINEWERRVQLDTWRLGGH